MNSNADFARLVGVINQHNSFAICLTTRPTVDTVASGLALYLGLNKLGKNVSIALADEIRLDAYPSLVGSDKIQKKLISEGNHLVVSFPYQDGAIDKVTYTIEEGYFNLLIQSKEGHDKLNPSQVKYAYAGGKIDTVFVIDTPSLDYLGDLYINQQADFKGKDIINIDRHVTNTHFGTINLVGKTYSSTSEIILKLLQILTVEITPDMATNLYIGIKAATNNFTAYTVSAQTFENSALLLKAGAAKTPPLSSLKTAKPSPTTLNEVAAMPEELIERKENDLEETPQDWLKPKIFKGSNLI